VSTATKTFEAHGFIYKGATLDDFLWGDEEFTATNGFGHGVVRSPRGSVRLAPGDFISRRQDGSLFTTSSDPRARASASPGGAAAGALAGGSGSACERCSCPVVGSMCTQCGLSRQGSVV
jgi:hypothetical protein